MRKKSILRLALLAVLPLTLNSCRTEDEVLPKEEQTQFRAPIEMFLKFEEKAQSDPEFRAQNREETGQAAQKNGTYNTTVNIPLSQVSYKTPFRETIEAFFKNNAALGQDFYRDFGRPFYNVSTYTYGNNSKAIAFPILQGDQVTAFIHGIVSPNRDYVQFTVVQNNDPVTLGVIAILQDAVDNLYPKNPIAMGKFAKERYIRVNDIEEITIIKFNVFSGGGGGFGYLFPGRDWWKDAQWKEPENMHFGGGGNAMSGDGSKHKFPDYLDPEDDPCEKAKKLMENPLTMKTINALKTKSTQGGENGYKIKIDGTPSDEILGSDHSVPFGDKTGYAGGYHNHTPTGIPMLSPPDIDQLLQFALAQGNQGDPNNAYIGMVAPNGMHYVARFNGGYNDALKTFSQQEIDDFVDNYEMRNYLYNYSNSAEGLEKLFFKTLSDMKLDGKVTLQRIENGNIIKTITKNSDGTITPTPCK